MRFHIAAAFLSTTVLAQDNSTTDTPMMGGGGLVLGADPCTYAPNRTCYPNPITPGWPLCCTIDSSTCTTEEPCFSEADIPANFTADFNMTDLPIDSIIGGLGPVLLPNMTGTSICTYAPDKVCYPATGWPSCCDTDPSSCPSTEEFVAGVNPPCEEDTSMMGGDMPMMGGSICTYAPDKVCYPATGWPSCCDTDPSSCPSTEEFVAGVNPPCEDETPMMGGGGLLGSNQCTYSPNATCYPNPVESGRPLCCTIDPSGQSCESNPMPCFEAPDLDEILASYNMTMADVQTLVADFMGGGDEPTTIGDEPAMGAEVPVDMSSSAILSMSFIALVSAHAVAFVTGMW